MTVNFSVLFVVPVKSTKINGTLAFPDESLSNFRRLIPNIFIYLFTYDLPHSHYYWRMRPGPSR